MLAPVLPGRAVLERGAYITPASRHGGHHQGHHGGCRVVRYAYRTGRTGAVEQLCTRPGLPGACHTVSTPVEKVRVVSNFNPPVPGEKVPA